MSKVNLLPESIISKIAAGEVVERPASAVKELLENALDAQTKSLEIHLKEAGKTLIHIKDSGSGIDKEDMNKIFMRHATSKIQNLDDLDNIQSLGFRGEALYSIGSISDITLRSKPSASGGQDSGWEIHLRGGEKISLKPVTMNNGTEIEVRELFFNTPARRKFLKSNTTEFNQILNIVLPYIIFHPECRFLVTHQGKTILDLAPTDSQIERTAQTLNLEKEHLISAKYNDEQNQINVRMILGNINIKRSRKDMQFIFVNSRPVQNRGIAFHMNQVYQLIFPPQTFPVFAVFIDMPANQLDINIHPTKREIKIKNEYQLTSILRQVCESALMSSGQAPQVTKSQSDKITREDMIKRALTASHTASTTLETSLPAEIFEATTNIVREQYAFPETQQNLFTLKDGLPAGKQANLQSKLSRARFIGSFINKFLLFESERTLFVVDQHAAQERIAFEKFMLQMDKGKVEVQQLLSPILIKLSPQEIASFEDAHEKLETIGLSSTMFDQETLALHSYPVLLKNSEPAVRYLLSGESISHCDHETIARRACRSSVMAGDYLNAEKAIYQRDQLIKCRDPFTCPHGRPTVIELTEKFLDKQFLRT